MSAQSLQDTAPAAIGPRAKALGAADAVLWLDQPAAREVARVGGKNAGLAQVTAALSAAGIRVPLGFATTAAAYRAYVQANDLSGRIASHIEAYRAGKASLAQTGGAIRQLFLDGAFPAPIAAAII